MSVPDHSNHEGAIVIKVTLAQWVVEPLSGAPAPYGTGDGAVHPSEALLLGPGSRKLQKHVSVATPGAAGVSLGQHHVREAALAPNCHHHLCS